MDNVTTNIIFGQFWCLRIFKTFEWDGLSCTDAWLGGNCPPGQPGPSTSNHSLKSYLKPCYLQLLVHNWHKSICWKSSHITKASSTQFTISTQFIQLPLYKFRVWLTPVGKWRENYISCPITAMYRIGTCCMSLKFFRIGTFCMALIFFRICTCCMSLKFLELAHVAMLHVSKVF